MPHNLRDNTQNSCDSMIGDSGVMVLLLPFDH